MEHSIVIVMPADGKRRTEEGAKSETKKTMLREQERLYAVMDTFRITGAEKAKREEVAERLRKYYEREFAEFKEELKKIRENINTEDYELFNNREFRTASYKINPLIGWQLSVFDEDMEYLTPRELEELMGREKTDEIWLVHVELVLY